MVNKEKITELVTFIHRPITGKLMIKKLIQNNGNLQETLQMDVDEFRRRWFDFVKKK